MTRTWVYVSAIGLSCACSEGTQTAAKDSGPGAAESGGSAGADGGGAENGGASASSGGASASSGGASTASGGASTTSGGAPTASGGAPTASGGRPPAAGGSAGAPACDEIKSLTEAYKAAHPGNGGKDWDINAKSPAELAADPDAQKLLAICGNDERPVIPLLAWEYGGGDHSWINPEASAVAYCVPVPVHPDSPHWQYDAAADHVTADIYVKCPELNPCKAETGANQVMACLGDPTNIEILVDTASLDDGAGAGLALANASTDLYLVTSDGTRVHMYTGL